MVCVLSLMTSCLKDSSQDVIYYDDAAITSFTLGTLKRVVHTKTKAGKDSVYTTTLNCSSYKFHIDQETGIIANVDSLPKGVDISKALVTIGTYNSSTAVYKSLTSDSIFYYQSTDSIDFTQPRTILCYSNDGSWNKTYKAQINVHKETVDSMYWTQKGTNSNIAALAGMKAFCHNGKMYVYGMAGNTPKLYSTSVKDGNNWVSVSAPIAGSLSMTTDDTNIYALTDDGKVCISADGETWTVNSQTSGISQLVAASRSEIYAIDNDGMLVSSKDNGATWAKESLDSEASFLPTRDINGIRVASSVNPELDKVIIIGNRNIDADTTAVVWSKTVDNNYSSKSTEWMYQKFDADNLHVAPALANVSVAHYNNELYMIGGNGINSCKETAFSKVYCSQNAGLNWWTSKTVAMPEGFASSSTSFCMASDGDRNIWLFCGDTGQVWVGYYSTYHWGK